VHDTRSKQIPIDQLQEMFIKNATILFQKRS
jgi:hypothetical protein